ncbi:MAG: nucleoside-diphosphate sugar epimerase [Pelagibacteraceae bacterium]|nr:nucleoside-diphosphate sugar epimerase [Pelagibacteraceae bacterium]|tara:strand:- start:29034 stop:30044 length:1011 start_codon:yes stop_codon:yes gene_type:complete
MKNKKVLIIGGAGFIGHNLAIYLKKRKFDVWTVDNLKINNLAHVKKNIKNKNQKKLYLSFLKDRLKLLKKNKIPLKICDVSKKSKILKIVQNFKPNIVIHLAAVSHDSRSNTNPEEAFENSQRTLFNSLESIKDKKNSHFIYFSSSMVYGNFKKKVAFEQDTCNPIGIYGSLKLSGELLVKSYSNVFGNKYTIVRPSALYGERCISNRVIQIFLENAFQRKKIFIKGDGREKLDFTYIDDLCSGIFKIVKDQRKSSNRTFNLTYGSARSINDLRKLTKKKFKNQIFVSVSRNKLMAIRGTLSIKKAKRMLKYNPKFSLEKGFEKYYRWYSKNYANR